MTAKEIRELAKGDILKSVAGLLHTVEEVYFTSVLHDQAPKACLRVTGGKSTHKVSTQSLLKNYEVNQSGRKPPAKPVRPSSLLAIKL